MPTYAGCTRLYVHSAGSGVPVKWWSEMFWSCKRSTWVTGNVTSILSGCCPSYFNVNTSHLSQICVPFSKTFQHCLHLQNFIPRSLSLCRICSHHSCGHTVLSGWHPHPLPSESPPPPRSKYSVFIYLPCSCQCCVWVSALQRGGTRDTWKILKTASPGSNQHTHHQQIDPLALCSFENNRSGQWKKWHCWMPAQTSWLEPALELHVSGEKREGWRYGLPQGCHISAYQDCRNGRGSNMAVRYQTSALLPHRSTYSCLKCSKTLWGSQMQLGCRKRQYPSASFTGV